MSIDLLLPMLKITSSSFVVIFRLFFPYVQKFFVFYVCNQNLSFRFHGLCKCCTFGFHFLLKKATDTCPLPRSQILNLVVLLCGNCDYQFMTPVASAASANLGCDSLDLPASPDLGMLVPCHLSSLTGLRKVIDFQLVQILLLLKDWNDDSLLSSLNGPESCLSEKANLHSCSPAHISQSLIGS